MWQARCESLDEGSALKYAIYSGDAVISYWEVLALWQDNSEFRSYFSALLQQSPFAAFRWETPPLNSANAERAFEFVLLQCNALERPVDRSAFARHFTDEEVVTFQNLSGDAVLIAPCPTVTDSIYGHLASFLRHAPEVQVDQLWKTVGATTRSLIREQTVWLSTAGMGVAWLHVRLDSSPKYYGYQPYRTG